MDFTLKAAVHGKVGEKKTRILFPLSVWNSSPIEHLAIYCSFLPVFYCCFLFCFFSCRWLILSRQTLPHQAQDKVCGAFPRVCTGTSSSWCGSSISGAMSTHLHMEPVLGGGGRHHLFCGPGCLPQAQFPPLGMQNSWQLKVIPLMRKVSF